MLNVRCSAAAARPHGRLILLPPNRAWRTYHGGRTLDQLARVAAPADSHFAEDWIASATRAINPPHAELSAFNPQLSTPPGVSSVRIGRNPTPHNFAELLASDPEYFLG